MNQILTNLWSKYNEFDNWKKKLLWAIPFILLAVLAIVLLIVFREDITKRFRKEVTYHKDYVDDQIDIHTEKVDILAEEEKKLEKEHKIVKEEIKRREEEALNTMDDIDSAVSNGDVAELERIRRRLNDSTKPLRKP